MEFPFHDIIPHLFPIEFRYLVAPFWADVDIERGMGDVSYQVYSTGSPLLNIVNSFITDERDFNFNGHWMLLAQWNSVSSYFNPTNEASCIMILCLAFFISKWIFSLDKEYRYKSNRLCYIFHRLIHFRQ